MGYRSDITVVIYGSECNAEKYEALRVLMPTHRAERARVMQGTAGRALDRLFLCLLLGLLFVALLAVVQLFRTEVKKALALLEEPRTVA